MSTPNHDKPEFEYWRPFSAFWRQYVMPAHWTPQRRLWLGEGHLVDLVAAGKHAPIGLVATAMTTVLPGVLEEIHRARVDLDGGTDDVYPSISLEWRMPEDELHDPDYPKWAFRIG